MSKKIKIKQKQKNEWLEVKGETVGERGGVGELGWSCFRVGMGKLLGGCEGGGAWSEKPQTFHLCPVPLCSQNWM